MNLSFVMLDIMHLIFGQQNNDPSHALRRYASHFWPAKLSSIACTCIDYVISGLRHITFH